MGLSSCGVVLSGYSHHCERCHVAGDCTLDACANEMDALRAPAAYEKPALTRSTVETATGRELEVLVETLYGVRRRFEAAGPETDAELRARVRRLFGCVDEVGVEKAEKDAAELAWWRTQFATRFPAGQLPKPGTALIGRRFNLTKVKPEDDAVRVKGPTFSCGVDFGLDQSKTVLTVLRDGELVASCELDNHALLLEVMHKAGGAFKSFTEELVKHMEHLFHRAAGTDLVTQLSDKMLDGTSGKLTERPPVQDAPPPGYSKCTTTSCPRYYKAVEGSSICNRCAASLCPKPLTMSLEQTFDQMERRYGPDWIPPTVGAPPATETVPAKEVAAPCCRIGGEKHKERQPCPFHDLATKPTLPPWAPEWDRFGFAKP